MTTKTERITILGSIDFKAFLNEEAAKESISVSELVRRRCEARPPNDADEKLFAELVTELHTSAAAAKHNLDKGIRDAEAVLKELRTRHADSAPEKKALAR